MTDACNYWNFGNTLPSKSLCTHQRQTPSPLGCYAGVEDQGCCRSTFDVREQLPSSVSLKTSSLLGIFLCSVIASHTTLEPSFSPPISFKAAPFASLGLWSHPLALLSHPRTGQDSSQLACQVQSLSLQPRSKESLFDLGGYNTVSNYPERLELGNTITFSLLLTRTVSGSPVLLKSRHFHSCINRVTKPTMACSSCSEMGK